MSHYSYFLKLKFEIENKFCNTKDKYPKYQENTDNGYHNMNNALVNSGCGFDA